MRDQARTVTAETPADAGSVPFGGARAAADVLLRPGQPLFYRIPEVMTMLAMSRSVAFEQLRSGRRRGRAMSAARSGRSRANGEGSIYPYKNGYAAYVWVTTPDRQQKRKYVYGKTREEVHAKWLSLHGAAKKGPVVTRSQTLGEYLAYWLKEVVTEPDYAPKTVSIYEGHTRIYIVPGLGSKRMDKLDMRAVRTQCQLL